MMMQKIPIGQQRDVGAYLEADDRYVMFTVADDDTIKTLSQQGDSKVDLAHTPRDNLFGLAEASMQRLRINGDNADVGLEFWEGSLTGDSQRYEPGPSSFEIDRQTHRPGWWGQHVQGMPARYDTVTARVHDAQGNEVLRIFGDEYHKESHLQGQLHIETPSGIKFKIDGGGMLTFPGWEEKDDAQLYPGQTLKVGETIIKPIFQDGAEQRWGYDDYRRTNTSVVGLEVYMDGRKLTYTVTHKGKSSALYGAHHTKVETIDGNGFPPPPQWDAKNSQLVRHPVFVAGRDGLYFAPQLGLPGGKVLTDGNNAPKGDQLPLMHEKSNYITADDTVLFDPRQIDTSKRLPDW